MLTYLSIVFLTSYGLIYAESPSFARQQIIDYPLDWYQLNQTTNYFSDYVGGSYFYINKLFHAENISDISSVTLSSDGKILNITFWLTGPFDSNPKKTAPEYYIRFDADSNLLTGDRFGGDYLFHVSWNNDTHSWEQLFQEYSPKNHVRIMQLNSNFTNFYSKLDSAIIDGKKNQSDYLNCCYVSFPVDLKLMNYPKTYAMSFHIKDIIHANRDIKGLDKYKNPITVQVNGTVEFLDSTADISIPTSTYDFAAESQKINLTEKHRTAPIFINSNSESPALLGLSVNKKTFPAKFVTLIPNSSQYIEPHGSVKFDLVYDGDITNTSSFILPINFSVYQRIDSNIPDKPAYSSTPTISTSSIILYLTQAPQVMWFDSRVLSTTIVTAILTTIVTVPITVILTLLTQRLLKNRREHSK